MIASKHTGFTLIEVMIAMAIIAILTAIAFPSYQNYITRSSRSAAQTELLELANLQEKIFLNRIRPVRSIPMRRNALRLLRPTRATGCGHIHGACDV